jgi:hypothetical protein
MRPVSPPLNTATYKPVLVLTCTHPLIKPVAPLVHETSPRQQDAVPQVVEVREIQSVQSEHDISAQDPLRKKILYRI